MALAEWGRGYIRGEAPRTSLTGAILEAAYYICGCRLGVGPEPTRGPCSQRSGLLGWGTGGTRGRSEPAHRVVQVNAPEGEGPEWVGERMG